MPFSSVASRTNFSEYRQTSLLNIEKIFAENQSENKNINIRDEMLVLQNGSNVNVSGQNYNSIKSSLTSDLYIDVTSDNQTGKFVKKEIASPFVAGKSSDVEYEGTIILPERGMRYEIITPDLKREPVFVSTGEENINSSVNHEVIRDVSGKRTNYIKQEKTECNDGFIADKTEKSNKSNPATFIKKEVEEEISKKLCFEDTRKVYDMDEQYDSFNEEMSQSEEEVNSSDIEDMFSEKKINENDRSLECLTCGKCFKLEYNLQKHALSHLNDGLKIVRKFECEICGKKFKAKQHLQRHNLSHTHKKEFACAHCQKSYFDKHDLAKHLATNHTLVECNVCRMAFDNHSDLRKHYAVHKKSERECQTVSCHICQKSFLKKRYLKRHLQIHARMTPYVCNQCNKSFLNPFLLREHSRTHTGEKPFQCDKCDRKFSTKSNQVRHSRTHLKTRMCNNCCAEFDNEEQFKAHKESCTLSYECGKCGLVCERLSNIRRHMKTHTKSSNPDAEGSIDSCSDSENIIVRIV